MSATVTTDLADLFNTLILPLAQPTGVALSAVAIPGSEGHRLAKDSSGTPCLLLSQPQPEGPVAPIRLQNLSVSYGVPCTISHTSGEHEEGTFTIVRCSGADPSLFPHFLRILSPIVVALGPAPTAAAVRRAIAGLVDLFRALTAPAMKSIQGLWAELLLIRNASDPLAVAAAWHSTPNERVDFVNGRQRIEAKSSSTRQRVHHFSLAQLMPPASARLIVASLFIERTGGGVSLRRLVDEIRQKLVGDAELLARFDAAFYSTLGEGWSEALEEAFDLELASESLQFFDARDIPKVDRPLPSGVSDVRFNSDLSSMPTIGAVDMEGAGELFAAIIPLRGAGFQPVEAHS